MITENELKNQIAIAQQIKKEEKWFDRDDQWALYGYIHALCWVLGTLKAKYDKEDI